MMRVIVAGAAGRMGRRVGVMVDRHPDLVYGGAFEVPGSPAVGSDAGELAGLGRNGVLIGAGFESVIEDGDVIIDFTFHEATMSFARLAADHHKAMVIGTTGLSGDQLAELAELSAHFPCVQAPNMSVCVNVLFKLVKKTAAILGNDFDIEILEAHHNKKKDAPSGTALKLGELAAEGVGRRLADVGVYERSGIIGERTSQEIGIQSIRAADIVGEHTVFFAGPGERLELTHRAQTRDHFARGATIAAAWLAGKPNGLYSMFDVLDLQDL
ncbi:4-hydroxy-tetrahydrodipicolinate reductase [Desulfofustis glycolicus]|uniref:4-hydroxy-tetrahydrodipicolinate reductase n=1 Tax=Desulfofustis glycolicus DSM 9705 TaxID=1121409 RepID=A0A1M5Y778_9BACT|nr:4-hydroxy-tetrahydrodipicolinate reductase [Desulfofustis glycolicus]MCB2216882.1 4-hydroxy-tetrahydrodipicolinate reductase [Desulfobulbaceae bacterium]SHI07917.1 dihydrodipicolinate reductase [Desulfofustis glycolicus DSM 9705]